MGRRGPPPTPAAILEQRGTARPDRVRVDEPKPEKLASLDPPAGSGFDRTARQAWNRKAPELLRLGLLTILDVEDLVAYCIAWSEWIGETRRLRALRASERRLLRGALSEILKRDELAVVRAELERAIRRRKKHFETWRPLAARFGFTPSDRRGLSSPIPRAPGAPAGDPAKTGSDGGRPLDPLDEFTRRRLERQQALAAEASGS